MSTTLPPGVQKVLEVLKEAVAAELDRKARLGHYVVSWEDGRAVMQGPDAPPTTAALHPMNPGEPKP
jgi:hypothetical protein